MLARSRLATFALLLTAHAVASAATATFTPLGDLAGGTFHSAAANISADGSTVVGNSTSANGYQAFRWTEATGMTSLGHLEGGELADSFAYAASADGSTIVGTTHLPGGRVAVRWTAAEGMTALSGLPVDWVLSEAASISADGTTIAVAGRSDGYVQGFLWTEGKGLVGLGELPGGFEYSHPLGVSSDGSIVVGESSSDHRTEAFLWTAAGGIVALGPLPGERFSSSRAHAVSPDGSTVVGVYGMGLRFQAFRWTSTDGMTGLGYLSGNHSSQARGVSADGKVVVGGAGVLLVPEVAVVWTAAHGMQSVSSLLAAAGVDLAGWQLQVASGISADGRVIVGNGINPSGQPEAWIATLPALTVPEPSGVALAIAGLSFGLTRRLSRRRRSR